ncbi:zinc transport system permease protein [Cohaesibacter marisflavi]|uniref:High-affinity zinc uptake system membrane protein ZnuB n=1 Tax=Cohaesibacter marisflavi TaxID=655353 RepID=A0A1I5IP11_9HYPH|nr:metal ABC transporter permease [Cohaesibacter marisflavi]SFO61911.1 zinc transport system permease protein [Cohaesibacter marisflavi]
MLDDFFIRALLGGIGIALVSGPLGCFIVWRRMAYFGETMSHAALLGISLSLMMDLMPFWGVFAVSIAIAMALYGLEKLDRLSSDTLLGILSHASLSIGLIALGFMAWLRVDVMSLLFGDILSITRGDLALIWGGGILVLGLLLFHWRSLLAATVSQDIASAEGLPTKQANLVFILLIALVIAVAMKLIGALLITSLLIIPAASARQFARSPEMMALLAAILACLSAILGLNMSMIWDSNPGPSIVLGAFMLFLLSLAIAPLVRALRPPQR